MKKLNKKILIIEDEPSLRMSLRDTFIAEGLSVLVASNGIDGLELALREKPDIILLDILMPGMDGQMVLKKLRESAQGKNTPVIVLTVLSVDDPIVHWITTYEPTYYLIKSDWRVEQIVEKVKERLSLPF
ncbi:MAG: response regulator receiver protein [Parcubacteria group bacterium Gr01-1014_17]|nr:MAG: response regulator receiver protein [Parcubacteria group bacterium Gr01-1014_17]